EVASAGIVQRRLPERLLTRHAGPPDAQQERDDDWFAPRCRQLRTLPWPDAREALARLESTGGVHREAGFQGHHVPGRPRANGCGSACLARAAAVPGFHGGGTPGSPPVAAGRGRKERMGRQAAVALYVLALVAVVVGVDVLFFRNRFWERLMVNVGIVLVFAA